MGNPIAAQIVLEDEFQSCSRGLERAPLTDMQFRLMRAFLSTNRPLYSDWLLEVADPLGQLSSRTDRRQLVPDAFYKAIHGLRRRLAPLGVEIKSRPGRHGERGVYWLSLGAAPNEKSVEGRLRAISAPNKKRRPSGRIDPDARRAYQRDYMRKRRSGRRHGDAALGAAPDDGA